MIWAVRRNPSVNAQWTDEEIIVKHYVNLGVAAATPRGLIVPNVKEAQAMTMVELATALEQLTLTAREGKTQPAEMQGGTITITNIGVFGMDTGTPILNPGEVGDRRARHDQAEAVGRRRRGAPALRHHDRRRRSITAWSTATSRAGSWPTSRRSSRSPRCCSSSGRASGVPRCRVRGGSRR